MVTSTISLPYHCQRVVWCTWHIAWGVWSVSCGFTSFEAQTSYRKSNAEAIGNDFRTGTYLQLQWVTRSAGLATLDCFVS